ncbi:hypothetical protein PIB30_065483 [Stylosanthes scabra]|uniref:Uncharacterized protein n=1 Tax=Stylosanthes scabra TaxID=79078 RepID=A0ABU6QLL1_9FABA|nr:hypothetical protein [Stylosanthes scabra]
MRGRSYVTEVEQAQMKLGMQGGKEGKSCATGGKLLMNGNVRAEMVVSSFIDSVNISNEASDIVVEKIIAGGVSGLVVEKEVTISNQPSMNADNARLACKKRKMSLETSRVSNNMRAEGNTQKTGPASNDVNSCIRSCYDGSGNYYITGTIFLCIIWEVKQPITKAINHSAKSWQKEEDEDIYQCLKSVYEIQ